MNLIFDITLFMARYAPFWGVPTAILSAELCYIYWMRERRKFSIVFIAGIIFSIASVAGYYYFGGPEKFSAKLIQFFQYLTT